MWNFIKFILGVIFVLAILSYFFRIPLSVARFREAVDSVRALIPEKYLPPVAKNSTTTTPATGSTGTVSKLQDVGKSIFAPIPLQIRNSTENGDLTRAGIIALTNAERTKVGIALLTEDPALDAVAEAKLKDLFDKQYFEHNSPTGVGPAELAKKFGYEYIIVGENLALGNFKDDSAIMKAWLDSQGHKENILQSRYSEIGVAVGEGDYKGDKVWIGVQAFGLPLNACPQASTSLKTKIDAGRVQVESLKNTLLLKKEEIDEIKDNDALYNQKVVEYNALVKTYDAQLEITRKDIATYNAQVQKFNACRQG